jgi:RNA polymerase sigma factor (TIGR02999 family)
VTDTSPPTPDPTIVTPPPHGQVTRLLRDVAAKRPGADSDLLEAVYAQLHSLARQKMAGERSGHTLGATGLVNEVYAKIFAAESGTPAFNDRAHFFRTAAQAMRRVLIDYARAHRGAKRGGDGSWRRVSLEGVDLGKAEDLGALLSIDEAICRLEQDDERAASVVRLRFYAGLELDAVAGLLGVTVRSVSRDWAFARAWLAKDLAEHDGASPGAGGAVRGDDGAVR